MKNLTIDDFLASRYITADGRKMYSSGTDYFKIFLGQTTVLKFDCAKKYLQKIKSLIKDLQAIEIEY